MTLVVPRHHLIAGAATGAGALCGFLAATRPVMAVALTAAIGLFALAFFMPVANLTLLMLVTAVVPYSTMNSFGLSAGGSSAGLILSDVLLLTALAHATLMMLRAPLSPRRLGMACGVVIVLAIAAVQALRAVQSGASVSTAGFELRCLLGWSTALIAIPMLGNPRTRERLFKGMIVIGLCLGLWAWRSTSATLICSRVGTRASARTWSSRTRSPFRAGCSAFRSSC